VPMACPPGFRREVLDLVAAGRPVAQVAHDLDISAQCTCTWRQRQLAGSGQLPGTAGKDHAGLVAARKRIAELEAGLAIHRKAAGLPGDVVPPEGGTRRLR
jgi:transposase